MRPKRDPQPGEYFLAPFRGKARDLLMRAVRPGPAGHWYVTYPAHPERDESYVLLSSCHRCTPSRAAAILGVIDCEGSSPCSTCPNSAECGKSGCVRIAAQRGNADAGSAPAVGVDAAPKAVDGKE